MTQQTFYARDLVSRTYARTFRAPVFARHRLQRAKAEIYFFKSSRV